MLATGTVRVQQMVEVVRMIFSIGDSAIAVVPYESLSLRTGVGVWCTGAIVPGYWYHTTLCIRQYQYVGSCPKRRNNDVITMTTLYRPQF